MESSQGTMSTYDVENNDQTDKKIYHSLVYCREFPEEQKRITARKQKKHMTYYISISTSTNKPKQGGNM